MNELQEAACWRHGLRPAYFAAGRPDSAEFLEVAAGHDVSCAPGQVFYLPAVPFVERVLVPYAVYPANAPMMLLALTAAYLPVLTLLGLLLAHYNAA